MLRKIVSAGLAVVVSSAAVADTTPGRTKLSATEIADRNIAAWGGRQAWRADQALSFTGRLGAGGDRRRILPMPTPTKQAGELTVPWRLAEEAELPFMMKIERPRKEHLEVQFSRQTAVHVCDGINGWNVRPFLNRRDIEPYSAQAGIDAPLVDFVSKRARAELAGMAQVRDRDTCKLKLTMKGGHTVNSWIKAKTLLETKIEGQPRDLDGRMRPVDIYYRDYRSVSGLQLPFMIETRVIPLEDSPRKVKDTIVPPERIVIEKAVVNPRLQQFPFRKPQNEIASNAH